MIRGVWQHFLLSLKLNFRSGRAIAYGYVMPVIFLLGFGSIFRAGDPRLLGQMGQILTITILGGCCMGMPTALVAERERGIWRRYQLLPVPVNSLLVSVLAVRLILVGTAGLIQLALARWIYGTPLPAHPLSFLVAFLTVLTAFLGLGLIITALARDVPSVQALGQCIFLPMILIGGVGVPLTVLPDWAQIVAAFMPGRYAVELLQSAIDPSGSLAQVNFSILALVVIAVAAFIAGLRLQRWEPDIKVGRRGWLWVITALTAWGAMGTTAVILDRTEPIDFVSGTRWQDITEEEMATITYNMLPEDDGIYTPLAPPLGDAANTYYRLQEFMPLLEQWDPGRGRDIGQNVRNLLSVASIADVAQSPSEALMARVVFEKLRRDFPEKDLEKALAWVILDPDAGKVICKAPELGFTDELHPTIVRERSSWYAKKFLGRIRGELEDIVHH